MLFVANGSGRVAQLVQRLVTGWSARGSNTDGARYSAHFQTDPGAHPAAVQWVSGLAQG